MKTTDFDSKAAADIIEGFGAKPEMLVQILNAFMQRFGWICDEAIRQLATTLNLSRAEVHGVVGYYHDYRTSPPGRHVVKVCQAEACQAVGSRELSAHATRALGLAFGTGNEAVTLEPVYCLGNCACSPAIMVDGRTYGRVGPERFDEIVAELGVTTR
jgi:formate dehydrogenase subunit gamma